MSISGIPSLGRFELAARVVLNGSTGSWFVAGIEDHEGATLLGEEIESISAENVAVLMVLDGDSLIAGSREHANEQVIFFTTVRLEDLHLDAARSSLQRVRPAVLAMPSDELARIASIAPHFTSWAGNRVFLVEEDRFLDEDAIEARLAALRNRYGMSDQEFLVRVTNDELPAEPEHAEWLVLLGRPDLLRSKSWNG